MTTDNRRRKIRKVISQREEGLIVVIEDLKDPQNAQAIFRSAEAFGVQKIYLIFEKTEEFDPKSFGKYSSASAKKWLDFVTFNSTEKCFNELKNSGYTTFATYLGEDSKDIYKTDFAKDEKIALIFGNESIGLSNRAVELSDEKIIIPMRGIIQSLNISVSAGIFLFEATRQRLAKNLKTPFSEKTQEALVEDFLER